MMKITYFDVLRGPFVDLDQASGRVPKILQNYAKMQIKSSQNEHEKICSPVLQWSKTHTDACPAKIHEIVFNFVVPGVDSSRYECKNR